MPWSIEERDGKYCVVKDEDGSTVKCHATQAKARAQQKALYAAEAKETGEKAQGEPGAAEVKETHDKMYSEAVDMIHNYVPWGVTTFAELVAYYEEQEAAESVHDLTSQFQQLLENVMRDETIEDKVTGIESLASEFSNLVRERMANPEETKETESSAEDEITLFERFKDWLKAMKTVDGKTQDWETPNTGKELGLMLWKEADGTYRWLARYSNNFRDQDDPPEIISEKSHRRFDELLTHGEAPMPDLWLWHRPEWKWGRTTWHAYDDSGFTIASGVVDKGCEWLAEAVQGEGWAVSHGMPVASIKRDEEDPTVIVEHITREISPLPAWAAANKLTGFEILAKEVDDMAIPQEKRDTLLEMGLDKTRLDALEAANARQADEADKAGVEHKEIKTEAEAETPQPEPAPALGEAEEPGVSRAEMQEALGTIAQAINALAEQIKEVQGQVVEVKETKKVEEAATLSELFERAIGHPAARVDGRTKDAKDRPVETEAEKPAVVNTGNPLANQIVNDIVSGSWLDSLREERAA